MKTRLAIVAAVAALHVPLVARAQTPAPEGPAQTDPAAEARRQYALGKTAYDAGRYTEAALAWEAASAIKPHGATLYGAGLAWERANRPERAADDFARARDVPGLTPDQAADIKTRLDTLERSLGTLLVLGPAGWRVQVDANTEVVVPARLHGAPGVHVLLVHPPGQAITRQDVSFEPGPPKTVDVTPAEAPPPPAVSAPPPEPAPPVHAAPAAPPPPAAKKPPVEHGLDVRRAIGFGVAGMGLATVGAGVVLGLQALDARDAYDAAPTRTAFDHAQSLQTWTNVAFVAGALLTAGGVVLVVLPTRAHVEATATLGGARIGGRF